MTHFKSNLRDIEFNLFEVFGRQQLLGIPPHDELDAETARGILGEVNRLATGPVAESFADGDRHPPVYDPATRSVRMPESFAKSFRAFMDAEWFRLELPPELGGSLVPRSLWWGVAELILGANPAVWMYASGAAFAKALWMIGTPEQREFGRQAIERKWTATMVLTEPDAGSDVGAGRTKAIEQPDGTWHIEGVKRFITGGEHDMSENIFHFVLARPEGAGPGTKGLSMFLVPKYLAGPDGQLGERNGVYATNVEHKMGLKVSTTCELTFGGEHPAVGTLIGGVHDGIRQMFMIIEYARMMVGTKAIATLSTGYLNALAYAKERVQGSELAQMTDKTAPRVTIAHHPDVRRILMLQKAYAEGMRALVLFTATFQDAEQLAQANGGHDDYAIAMNDLLLPVVKGAGSERAYEMLTQALQTFGGSGYLQDYPLEQYIRDAKIDSLYEGTTAIQGLDLYFRKIVRNQGQALADLFRQIRATATAEEGNGRLKTERMALARAADNVEAIVNCMHGYLAGSLDEPGEINKVGLNTTRLLLALGDLIIGWLLVRQAEVAMLALDSGTAHGGTAHGGTGQHDDTAFYTGKVAAARFFAANVLPKLAAEREIAEATSNDLMDLPEAAF
ncbi:MAG TPA: acyl-CoA dehydrogenase [Streptosporangiaceae bacterium]|nr:acyl-CoA dehydrogenase [Streptosporangiaceae bacterium]